jgi:DNA processing protein
MSAVVDLVALTLLPVWRWRVIAEQIRSGQALSAILEQHCDLRASRPPRSRSPAATPAVLRSRAAAAIERAEKSGMRLIAWSDPRYPAALAAIVDPPPVLWLRGCEAVFDAPAVAVVGSRAGSPYALAVAERLSSDLAERGVVVISGLARGVDSAAHRGALAVHGRTLAVLGCGVDVVYPREHVALASDIVRAGAIVSELVPGTPPRARFFPRRNRIISGLARAVVVIEAGEKSGSLITARCALEQGRDVLAVPGNVLNGRNRGGHALLRDGATIVETADDILEELKLAPRQVRGTSAGEPAADSSNASVSPSSIDPVLACLTPGETCDLDAISERSGLAPARLLTCLFELELRGLVGRAGGGRFVRLDRSC